MSVSPLALFEGEVERNKVLSTGSAVCRTRVVHVLELELALELAPAISGALLGHLA